MRVVLDLNVLISGLITPGGSAEKVVVAFVAGALEVVACPRWLGEVGEVLARERFTRRVGAARSAELRALVREFAVPVPDLRASLRFPATPTMTTSWPRRPRTPATRS